DYYCQVFDGDKRVF
nr:immunoglobulin light chain junction region [Macaca mulatta]MOW17331.1 immunoglobulin light chain junction region [Macaca mulatta]MOW18004.1 immunoglobulin light chain junction region [Macaca mulatta]MOW18487.1 immunoglobulin light chain junction region [Macaca mulatta]